MQCKGEKSEWMDAEDHLNCAYLVKHAESCAPFFTFGNGKCACQIKDTMNEECEEMETKNGFNVYFLEEQGLVLENEEEEEIDGGDNGDAPWCEKVKCQENLCSDGKPRRQVGGNCCSCPVSPAKIPKNCVTWYDGCNTCNVKDGKPTGCTKKACLLNTNPYCKQYVGQVNGDGPVIMDGAVQRGRQ